MARVITGFHAVEQFLRHPVPGSELLVDAKAQGKRVRQLTDLARQQGIRVVCLTSAELDRYGSSREHRGILMTAPDHKGAEEQFQSLGEFFTSRKNRDESLVLFLDGITDPHNLGAILRSADQFKVDAVVLPGRRSSHVNETVMSVSSGAARFVPVIVVSNLVQALRDARKASYWIYASDMDGETLEDVPLTGRTALVLGAEGKGISRLAGEISDRRITIPCRGNIDSLNVSVAAGILLYEVRRQQGWKA